MKGGGDSDDLMSWAFEFLALTPIETCTRILMILRVNMETVLVYYNSLFESLLVMCWVLLVTMISGRWDKNIPTTETFLTSIVFSTGEINNCSSSNTSYLSVQQFHKIFLAVIHRPAGPAQGNTG